MKISLDNQPGGYTIRSYRAGEVRLSGGPPRDDDEPGTPIILTESFIVTPDRLVTDWPAEQFETLQQDHFAALAELRPQVVLFGSGERLRFPPATLLRPLVELSIGVEVMDTGAACRTYNLLAAEGRMVAAALLIR